MKDYISDDYLGRLNPKSEGTFPGRDDNDNGILFLAMMFMMARLANEPLPLDCNIKASEAIRSLEKLKGLYHRRAVNPTILDAHDNYIGICALSVMFWLPFAEDIVRYGSKTGYNYNNLKPDERRLDCQRQGGDIAFYKLCAGYSVEPWYVVWLVGGLIVSAFKSDPSTMNLGWLRFETLKMIEMPDTFVKWTIGLGELIYNFINAIKGKDQLWAFGNYFRAEHPIYFMGKKVYGTRP